MLSEYVIEFWRLRTVRTVYGGNVSSTEQLRKLSNEYNLCFRSSAEPTFLNSFFR